MITTYKHNQEITNLHDSMLQFIVVKHVSVVMALAPFQLK